MKTAYVTLIRGDEHSAIMNSAFVESVRGVKDIIYAPAHVVFVLEDGRECAYKADRIHEFVTEYEGE